MALDELDLLKICDDYGTHKHHVMKAQLERHPIPSASRVDPFAVGQ
ncbi:hypothetical protein [Leucobacter japonicus]|nr:hypothetical protein [Leucobacter japonicus]